MVSKAHVSERDSFDVNPDLIDWDMVELREGSFHIIRNGKSFSAEVISAEPAEKAFVVKVNGNKYTIQVEDEFDQLAKSLGLNNTGSSAKAREIKAPMPGMVSQVLVEPGQKIKKGEAVIILEAMKMENALKATGDGVVKTVYAQKGMAVDKGQRLIELE